MDSRAAARFDTLRRTALLAGAVLMLGVLVLGATPLAVGAVREGWDKLAHGGLHGTLALLGLAALGRRRAAWVLLACAAFGALDEGLQVGHPGRQASVADFVADLAGAALVVGTALRWPRRAPDGAPLPLVRRR
jgi:VanZ family protein